MNHKNLIKTQCGLEKFQKLSKTKTFIGRLRLGFFLVFAALRDFNKKG